MNLDLDIPIPVNPEQANTLSGPPIGTKEELLRELSRLAGGSSNGTALMNLGARLNSTITSAWPDPTFISRA